MSFQRIMAAAVALLIVFAALAQGAHDLWAATLVYLTVLVLLLALLSQAARPSSDGLRWPLAAPALAVIAATAVSFSLSSNPSESYLGFTDWLALLAMYYISVNVFGD